ncbi:MAG TPA: type II toxin-antitoxin system RelE/ParE family toxin [Bryobacteraceae bacterium]|nr:type II toxin-antitoxin system RelE/ParE family toxin [Bryobacteraceae bacterium]
MTGLKPVIWIGSSLKDLWTFPEPVQDHMGYALYVAQRGGKHRDAKPLNGFGGAGVVEVVTDFRGDTFRAVYVARYADAIYVLHAFQKKSKAGRETPRRDLELIQRRLREAESIAASRSHE